MYFILQYIGRQNLRVRTALNFPVLDYQEYKKQPGHHPASTIQIIKPKDEELKTPSATKGLKSRSRSLSASKPSVIASTIEALNELSASASYIENKEVLINPDCYLGSILDYIFEVVGLPRSVHFTMCTATSEPVILGDSPLSTPGLDFFVPKETYYIILKDYDHSGNEVLFPLLHRSTEIYSHLMSKLRNDFVEPPKRQSITSTSSSKLKTKEVFKPKNRVKSTTSQKEGKSQTTTLPPIKQRN